MYDRWRSPALRAPATRRHRPDRRTSAHSGVAMNLDEQPEQEMLESVADALLALTNVGFGDCETRLKVEPEDTGALASLYSGINDMIASLGAEQEKSRAYQKELEG